MSIVDVERELHDLLAPGEWSSVLESLRRPAPRAIRLRRDRSQALVLPFATTMVPWFGLGRIVVDDQLRPSQSLHYAAADYYIQDAGSLLALALLDAKPHELICDLCAAPGGKASGIGESLGAKGFLIANEPIQSRVGLLRYMLSRVGNGRYAVTNEDPDELAARFPATMDAVLVDAPCSGQTLVGKVKRDANGFDRKQIEHATLRQQRILLAAARMLKPGGRLVYSTCTFSSDENESQMRWLRDRHAGCWEPILRPDLQTWSSPVEPGCLSAMAASSPNRRGFRGRAND